MNRIGSAFSHMKHATLDKISDYKEMDNGPLFGVIIGTGEAAGGMT